MLSTVTVLYSSLLFLSYTPASTAIIGYDCGHRNMSFARISLRSVSNCNSPTDDVTASMRQVYLLELNNDVEINVLSCKIEVYRDVYYCGSQGHIYLMTGGKASYMYHLGSKRCKQIIEDHETTLFSNTKKPIRLSDIRPGTLYTKTHTFAGWTDTKGYCGGDYYQDPFGSWDNAVVIGQVKILVNSVKASADIEKDTIHLPSGLVCSYRRGECMDDVVGEVYWTLIPEDNCNSYKYSILYKGLSNITTTTTASTLIHSLVTVSTDQILFSLKLIGQKLLCGATLYQTEHPKLFIIINDDNMSFLTFKRKTALSLDLFTYINSKFVYIERLMQMNMKTLYHQISTQQCELRKQTLILQLTIAKIDPDEFAYIYTESAGYSATKLGEVIYLIKCQPVPVTLRKTQHCYQELPVNYNNQSYFLTPKTRLLQKVGSQISCNNILPPAYELEGSWYSISTTIAKILPPDHLNPTEIKQWIYESPNNLATAGIYSSEDLDSLREHIMYGAERHAIENVIVRGFINQNPDYQGGSLLHMLDDNEIEKFGHRIRDKIWGWMQTFGNISSGFICVLMILRVLKWLFDSIVNMKLLHGIFGYSLKLLAAVSESLTMCLTHRYIIRKFESDVTPEQDPCLDPSAPKTSDSTTHIEMKPFTDSIKETTHHTEHHSSQIYPQITSNFIASQFNR